MTPSPVLLEDAAGREVRVVLEAGGEGRDLGVKCGGVASVDDDLDRLGRAGSEVTLQSGDALLARGVVREA